MYFRLFAVIIIPSVVIKSILRKPIKIILKVLMNTNTNKIGYVER